MSRDPVRQMDRLQGKLADICDAIDLPPGGGDNGYILPAVERLVDDHKRSVAHADRLFVEIDRLREENARYRAALQHLITYGADEEPKARAFARSVLGPATTSSPAPSSSTHQPEEGAPGGADCPPPGRAPLAPTDAQEGTA